MKNIRKWFLKLDSGTKKTIVIVGTIIIVSLIVIIYYLQNQSNNYNNIKQDKGKYLVYSKVEVNDNDHYKYIPFVNIKSETADKVNEDIDLFTNKYLNSEKAAIIYEYDVNGIILSIIVKIFDYEKEYAPEVYFRSYNINLNTKELISNKSLLDFFEITEEKVSNILDQEFHKYYDDLTKEGYYVEQECNFKCFLGYKGIDNYLDNANYYVKKGNLVVYRPFTYYSIFNDEEYFENEDFEFLLVNTQEDNQ